MAAETTVEGSAGLPRRLLRPFVVEAVGTPAGPALAAALEGVMGGELSAREWVEVAAAWKKVESYAAAGRLTAVARVDRAMSAGASSAPGRDDPVRPAADELAPALRIAPRTASHLVAFTRRLDGLPAAWDALGEGRLDHAQVRILDQVTQDLPAAARAAVETAALRWAGRRTPQQLRADLAAKAMEVDPSHAAVACERGVTERDASFRRSPLSGCGRLVTDTALIPGTAAWLAVNTAAKNARKAGRRPDGTVEDRTLAQLRADIVTALLTGQGDPLGGHVPTPEELSRLAEVHVVVAADTLAGRDDLPAHIPGIGPVDADTARELATRAGWRRLVADPESGALQHIGEVVPAPGPQRPEDVSAVRQVVADPRWAHLFDVPVRPSYLDDGTGYRPSARLRRFVVTRDGGCIGPACFHPAVGGQLDHTINHGSRDDDGRLGRTTDGNLGSECDRVHNSKTHGGWLLRQLSPGLFEWTSPTGRVYLRRARPLVPGWRHRDDSKRERPPPKAD
ncbi:MAG TPA: DUF222 domain-containing protein [Actinomycetales bacterium]|nr:DUF222 domain-containing protein [Actinomycetales bacterium]